MFIILGLLILTVSFVIALVSLIGEQKQIENAREKMAPRQPPVVPESGQKEVRVDQEAKIPQERGQEIYPWQQVPKVGEAKLQKFDKVTISIRDLANSSKRESKDT